MIDRKQTTPDKQFLLLVDDNDIFSGKYEEKEICHKGHGLHHRAFVACLFNSQNELLLQKRKHKRWDNVWDVTGISHTLHFPDHDESYREAALRSLKDEMGIDTVSLKKIGGFNYFAQYGDQCENEYCAVLTGSYDKHVQPNNTLVYAFKWMKKENFIHDCKKNPTDYAPWTLFTAKLLETQPIKDD